MKLTLFCHQCWLDCPQTKEEGPQHENKSTNRKGILCWTFGWTTSIKLWNRLIVWKPLRYTTGSQVYISKQGHRQIKSTERMTFLILSLEMQVEGIQEKEKGNGIIYSNRVRSLHFRLTLNSTSSNFCFLLCLVDSSERLAASGATSTQQSCNQECYSLSGRCFMMSTPSW